MLNDPQTLAGWFERRAEKAADRPALTFEGNTWSYAQMRRQIDRIAHLLRHHGVAQGDRVAYLGFNRPECLFALLACASLGAIFVPLNFRLTASELNYLMQDADVTALLVGEEHVSLAQGFAADFPKCSFIVVGDATAAPWPSLDALLGSDTSPTPTTPARPPRTVSRDDIAVIVYTSGTTGRPKGAMLSHANLWANNLNWILAFGIGENDVVLTAAPMFHVSGLFVLLSAALMVGGHVVLHRSFDAVDTLRAIETHRITLTFSVPTMLLFMSQQPDFDRVDLSSLRLVVVGGAPTPESLLRCYAARDVPVSHCYGMSECVSASTYLETGLAMTKLNSAGRAMALAEIKLIDSAGRDVESPRIKGEICVRGENVTPGYWRNPEASAAALMADGWLRTGDVGYLDEDGFLYVCDRVKDMIISGGENVYPAEIEAVLLEHPGIANAAVIGRPDPRWGECVVAVIVAKPGASLTLESVLAFCDGRLARYKLPKELRILDQLPLNGAGKVVKQQLRQMLA